MSFWKWSRTAANNATADGSINWAEGQAPSTVNDSARAMMAAASKYRDDVAGAIATAGSASAYTLASFQVFDTLAHMDGAMIAFTAHAGNAGAGDRSTTFNLPDLRGYLLAGKDDMGGAAASRITAGASGIDGTDADHGADARARPRRQRSGPRPRRERPEPQPRRQRSPAQPQHELFDRRDHQRRRLAVRIRRQCRRRRQRRHLAGERHR